MSSALYLVFMSPLKVSACVAEARWLGSLIWFAVDVLAVSLSISYKVLSSSCIFGPESLDRFVPRESICIQGVWTEQRFPLSSYEASGVWSYRLACEAATISLISCVFSQVTPVWVYVAPVWILVAASYGLLVLGLFVSAASIYMNIDCTISMFQSVIKLFQIYEFFDCKYQLAYQRSQSAQPKLSFRSLSQSPSISFSLSINPNHFRFQLVPDLSSRTARK
ncbi:hypothetical protein F2Q70_00015543 [Brassica cretica]|uniref:Uncharacterized protein n=1 Tax=Brassica cretica TaxID=69181 RepID=A0A8S9I2T4_BRACR|nr:hypothetical protein F2Q70_00015543 [Brassica cretica]